MAARMLRILGVIMIAPLNIYALSGAMIKFTVKRHQKIADGMTLSDELPVTWMTKRNAIMI